MNVSPTIIPLVSITSDTTAGSYEGQTITFQSSTNAPGVSYQWNVNSAPVNGATSSTFSTSALKNGDSVNLVLTAVDSCIKPGTATSNMIIVTLAVGVKNVEETVTDIRLVPNPNNGNFTLRGTLLPGTNPKDAYVEVLNALGAVIYKEALPVTNNKFEQQIQLNDKIANGLYMVRINIAGHSQSIRFISQK
jgi:hypothetical protein